MYIQDSTKCTENAFNILKIEFIFIYRVGGHKVSVDKQQVSDIIEAIGGKENISAATHCVTRLRFALADESKVNKEKLESLDLVKGSFSTNGQFQVVIGPGTVEKVYKELINQTGASEGSKDDVKKLLNKI